MNEYRFPRTFKGWRWLFWLAIGRCPIHHSPLRIDNIFHDDGRSAYCFDCEGVGIWPQGATEALRQNELANRKIG